MEALGARERLSAIRRDLSTAGYSYEDIHEIILAVIERRKAGPHGSRFGLDMAVMGLGVIALACVFFMDPQRQYTRVPDVLLVYGFYLWYNKPRSE